jgi:hypothetical protein
MVRAVVCCLLAACWSSPPTANEPRPPVNARRIPLQRAIIAGVLDGVVRFGPVPGVWLEVDRKRWLIDAHAHELWRSFADRMVTVTGTCFRPTEQGTELERAVASDQRDSTHFEVQRMKLASAALHERRVPPPSLAAIGPVLVMYGSFVAHRPNELRFREDGGPTFALAGSAGTLPPAGRAAITTRIVEPSPEYIASTTPNQLWILAVHPIGYTPTPPTSVRMPTSCVADRSRRGAGSEHSLSAVHRRS